MIHRLPLWVWAGGFLLTAVAGYVNAVGLLGVHHQGLTHVTGQVSVFGLSTARGEWGAAAQVAALVLSFLCGAVISGALIPETSLRLGRRYGVALMIESLLLAAAALLLIRGYTWGDMLLAASAGLQNAMATTFSGAIVRTTHLTGVVTDLGILLGHAVRGGAFERKKLSLLLAIAAGFVLGAITGALAYQSFHNYSLLVPVAVTGVVGAGYSVYRQFRRTR